MQEGLASRVPLSSGTLVASNLCHCPLDRSAIYDSVPSFNQNTEQETGQGGCKIFLQTAIDPLSCRFLPATGPHLLMEMRTLQKLCCLPLHRNLLGSDEYKAGMHFQVTPTVPTVERSPFGKEEKCTGQWAAFQCSIPCPPHPTPHVPTHFFPKQPQTVFLIMD